MIILAAGTKGGGVSFSANAFVVAIAAGHVRHRSLWRFHRHGRAGKRGGV